MNWIINNKEWVFSGIGVTVIVTIVTFAIKFVKKRSTSNAGKQNAKNELKTTNSIISQNNAPITSGRDAIIGNNIVVHNETISPPKCDAQVEVVDVDIFDIYAQADGGSLPLGTYIDVKLRNKGDNIAFLTGAVFDIQHVFRLSDPRCVDYSPVPFSETYDIVLNSDSTQHFSISQAIKANDVDRFRLKVVSKAWGRMETVYKFKLSFIYNEDKQSASAGKFVAVFPPTFTSDGWHSSGLDYSTWKSNYNELTDISRKCESEGDVQITKTFKSLMSEYEYEAKLSKEKLMSKYKSTIFINLYGHISKDKWEEIDRQIKEECEEKNEAEI